MSESTPLLSKSSTDSDSIKQPSILANYIAGLSSGHLPSNPQLYLLLHKAAGFLEGISQAKVSLPTTQNHQNQSQNADPNLATDFLQESSQLCRDLSRWLSVSSSSDKNNNKDVQEQLQDHQQEQEDDSLSEESDDEKDKELNQKIRKTRKDQKEEELKELPRGNQNEQIQRFIWNLIRSFQEYQFNIDLNLNLKTDGIKMEEVKEDIKEGAEQVKEGAQTVTTDVKKGGGAIESLVEVFAAALVPEIQQLVLDLTLLFRENLADKASTIHEKAKGVEEQVRPDEQEQESDSPIKDLAQATKDAAGVVLGRDGQDQEASAENGKEGKGKGKEQDPSELDEKDSLWISEASERIGRVLEKAQASPSYSPAVQTLFSLSHRYASFFTSFINYLSESVPDKVVSGKDQVISAATEAIDGAEPEVPLDLGGAEDYFREACKAFEEVLIGLAGGQSLDPIKKSMRNVVEDLKGDGAWSDWWNDFKEFLNKTATKVKPEDDDEEDQREKEKKSDANGEASSETKKDASSTSNDDSSNFKVQSSPPSETKVELQNLLTRLQVLMKSKPQYREHLNELTSKIQDFRELMEIEPLGAKIRHRLRKIFASLKDSLDGGWESLKTHGKSTLKDLFFAILPSVMDVIKVLPMPRIEFLSDDLEATVDDLTIPVVQLIPDKIKVSTQLDAEYDRTSNFSSTNVDSSINVAIEGLKLELKDISFYLCEHFTAPKPTSLFGCCSCQCISSCNHCCGGPSNWLSYTERAFLDVGFGGEGVGLEIDLVDSGQNPKYKDEEEDRSTFFDVRKVKVDMKESFDFKLRNSRHWLINASLRPILRPVVRLVLQRVISEQVEHGYNNLDKWSYDIYSRAKYLANDGYENVGIGNDEKSKKKGEIKEPGMFDYLAVLINSEKGKSKARIRKEKKEKEIKEREEKKEKEKKDEELEEVRSHQPEGMKEMRIKPSGIIKTDPSGSYSVSIGLSDPLLPGPEHSGPRTNRTELRSDVIHGNWKRLGKRSTKGIRDAASGADVLGIARNVGQSVGDSVKRVGEIKELVKEERQEEREEIRKDRDQGKDDWRSEIFDL